MCVCVCVIRVVPDLRVLPTCSTLDRVVNVDGTEMTKITHENARKKSFGIFKNDCLQCGVPTLQRFIASDAFLFLNNAMKPFYLLINLWMISIQVYLLPGASLCFLLIIYIFLQDSLASNIMLHSSFFFNSGLTIAFNERIPMLCYFCKHLPVYFD